MELYPAEGAGAELVGWDLHFQGSDASAPLCSVGISRQEPPRGKPKRCGHVFSLLSGTGTGPGPFILRWERTPLTRRAFWLQNHGCPQERFQAVSTALSSLRVKIKGIL